MKLKYLAVVVLFTLILIPAPALQAQEAPPPLPALCYGELTVNGQPAPVGTRVAAKVDGELAGEIVTDEVGKYGGPGLKPKLTVSGEDLQGKMVRFYISGTINGTAFSDVFAGEELFWGSGEIKQINLGVADVDSAPAPDPPDDDPAPDAEEPEPAPEEDADDETQEAPEEEVEEEPEAVEEETEEALDDSEDLEEDQDVASGVLSNGWTIAAVVIIAAVLVTLVAGYIVRRPGRQ